MYKLKSFCLVILVLSSTLKLVAQNTYSYSKPESRSDGWKTNSLENHSIDDELIVKMFTQFYNEKHDLHSVLLVKNDELILEEYFGNYSIDTPHDLRSTTKNIRSILAGIAINKGYIESIDDPIFKYLKSLSPKKNKDPRKQVITINHLMTMSTGLDCNDWNKKSKGQEDKVYKKKNWLQYTIDLPIVNDPGTVSEYCSMGVVLLAEIISQASGMSIQSFADQFLFKPIGISNLKWDHTSKKNVIESAKRIHMTPRDMAKIGQLILNKGSYNGTQIVSKEWIEESTSPKTKITNIDYGYLWWNIPFQYQNRTTTAIVATGNGGQYIMIYPELEMVAVFTGGAYNSEKDKIPFAIMNQIVIPSLSSQR